MDINRRKEKTTDEVVADYLARSIKYKNTTTGTPVNQLYQKTISTGNLTSSEKSRIKDKLNLNDASKPKDVRDKEKKERQMKKRQDSQRNHALLRKEDFKTFPKDKVNRQIDRAKAKVDKEVDVDPQSIKNSSRAHSMTAARNFATKNTRPNKSIGVATNIMRKSIELDRRAKEADQKQRNAEREFGNEVDKAHAQGFTKDVENRALKLGADIRTNTVQKAKLRSREKAIDTVQNMGARASGEDNETQFRKNAKDKDNLRKLKSSLRRTDMETNFNKEELELVELQYMLEQDALEDNKLNRFKNKIRAMSDEKSQKEKSLRSPTSKMECNGDKECNSSKEGEDCPSHGKEKCPPVEMKKKPHGGDGGGVSTKSKNYTLFGEGHCKKCEGEKCECGPEEKKKDSKRKNIIKTQYSMTVPRDDDNDGEGGDGGGMSEAYSNWRVDLIENGYDIESDRVANINMVVKKSNKSSERSAQQVKEKGNVKNKVLINPPLAMTEGHDFYIISETILTDEEASRLIEATTKQTKLEPKIKKYKNQPSNIASLKSYSIDQGSKQQHDIQKRKHGVAKSGSRGDAANLMKNKDKKDVATSSTRGTGKSTNPNLSQRPDQNFSPDRRLRITPKGTTYTTAKTKTGSTTQKTTTGFKQVNPEREIVKKRTRADRDTQRMSESVQRCMKVAEFLSKHQ